MRRLSLYIGTGNRGFQSTHSLRSATIMKGRNGLPALFQSTHSLRSATNPADIYTFLQTVSIHALLAECDRRQVGVQLSPHCFNPRTPCGVRPVPAFCPLCFSPFQSTHSLRSATSKYTGACHEYAVSIHALLAECDFHVEHLCNRVSGFNPRTPCGVRLASTRAHVTSTQFQSTHSLRSATSGLSASSPSCAVSIHALLAECDGPC